jgi:hypothetical protein
MTNLDPNSPYLIHCPLLDDLKNNYTKNLFINFFLENVVQTSGYSLIAPGTLVEMTFLKSFFWRN